MDDMEFTAKNSWLVAKNSIGKKAILIGGGMPANEFEVVEVIGAEKTDNEDIQFRYRATLKAKRYPSGEIYIFEPWLYSWILLPYPDTLPDLPIGAYILLEDKIVEWGTNIRDIFATIYDLPAVAVRKGDRFVLA